MASNRGWWGANLDIRTAFLNAPMKHVGAHQEADTELKRVLLKPANILVKMGFFRHNEFWEVLKALYGLREMMVGEDFLVQMETEAAMWMIRRAGDNTLYGIVVTYVDDILVLSDKERVEGWTQEFGRTWETTPPEWVGRLKPTRFLGMQMLRSLDGVWTLNQESYTYDLFLRNLGKQEGSSARRKIPISRDGESEELLNPVKDATVEKEPVRLEDVREAQRVVGELVRLVTRCRPDIMFVLSRMSIWTTRKPKLVLAMAPQVWKFLADTRKEGLVFAGSRDGRMDLEIFSDASFGDECQGCVVVKWGGAPILWKSSRQAILTTSTAGAELLEVMEGATMGEAVKVVAEELCGGWVRCWQYTDSAAAMSIVNGHSGSWRTKHLRRRAKYVRWRIMKGEIIMRHLPGAEIIADLGTKALSAAKLRELKNLLGMTMDGGFNSQEGGMRGDIQVVVDQAVMVSEESAEAAPELTQVQKPE